jgi:hypothetical protein
VLPPGSRKGAVFAAMVAPILAVQRSLTEGTAPAIIEAELASKVAGKAAEKAALAAANADGSNRDTLIAEATAAAMNAEAITIPAKPQLVADDVTSKVAGWPSSLRKAASSPRSPVAIPAPRTCRCSSKGHAGDLMRVGRPSRDSEQVDMPSLTMRLAVQPEILRDIAGMPGFRGLGLLARVLFALPENTVGFRKIGADPIPTEVVLSRSYVVQRVCGTLGAHRAVRVSGPDADLQPEAPAGRPGRVRHALQRAPAAPEPRSTPPFRCCGHRAAVIDLACVRVRRRKILNGLISEYSQVA